MTTLPKTKEDVWMYLFHKEDEIRYTAQLADDIKNPDGAKLLLSIADQINHIRCGLFEQILQERKEATNA